ncbi:GntR family transcriptional regulator [Spirochaeta isovalerica]|uniref:DNA-binding GntR family transcriptional regulator n=1 Tax=Spirochaeta isovalerica TaxID=150 RepID=A0A841RC42_9SPIO|nr:GntR family transcriptional regulator [Spirochaeta isovalerica]MBB6479972.1 DNA-binding GntR family transcriptional regulator [Spirochaeta isovalerica]
MSKDKNGEKSSYEKMKELVLEGRISPGFRLTEAFLAEKLDMSRIPVREAIQQLVHEGFIERTGKNGYQIKEYNEQDIIDLYNYREALDGMLVRLYTQRVDDSQLYYLEMNVEAMDEHFKNFDQHVFSKIDQEFHRIIARGARNQYMEHQHEIILEKVLYIADMIYRIDEEKHTELLNPETYRKTYDQHCEIFNAIKERDPDKAERAARDSVEKGLKQALQVLSRRH